MGRIKNVYKINPFLVTLLSIIFFTSAALAQLTIESAYPTLGLLGQDLEVAMTGLGFNESTKGAMYLDSGNRSAILNSVETPGGAWAVAVAGDTVYIADKNRGLQVIDAANPTNVQIIGSVEMPDSARALAFNGNTVYVADYSGGLQVVDVSDPTSPQIIGSVNELTRATDITVIGDMAYMFETSNFDEPSFVYAIDISDPSSPQIMDSRGVHEYSTFIAVCDGIAYVPDGVGRLQLIDISDPGNLQYIGTIEDLVVDPYNIIVNGDTAYVADGNWGFKIIDVSDPMNPEIVGAVDTPGKAWDVAVVNDRAYVADQEGGLQVIDVSNPSNPIIIGSVYPYGDATDVGVVGNTAYVVVPSYGLQVVDVRKPGLIQYIGSVSTTDNRINDIAVSGELVFAANSVAGLRVIDVSEPENPMIIGTVDTGQALSVEITNTYVYVADLTGGLQIIDVNNPALPTIIGSVDSIYNFQDVEVVNDNAYVVDGWGWDDSNFHVIDVSNAANPQVLTSIDTPDAAYAVKVVGNYAYVADGNSGLQIINISDPGNPHIVGSVDTPGFAIDIEVVNSTAYVADVRSGLIVIDVSNPANPQIIGSVDTPSEAISIDVVGNHVYIADKYSGIQLIDVSNPELPRIIGSMTTHSDAWAVTIDSGRVYVGEKQGLIILPTAVDITPVTVINPTSLSADLPSPIMAGQYTLSIFNNTERDELVGAVSFTTNLTVLNSKAIIVAGGGPDAAGEIWEETKQSANRAYDILIHEGFDHDKIWYLTNEFSNPFRNGSSRRNELDYAINEWAQDASKLIIFFVDHGLPNNFIIYDSGASTEQLSVGELDDWLDNLQQSMIGSVTFIYDACHSGTFADRLIPPAGKERIVITGASDEPAYFRGEDSFSIHFWEQILLKEGNVGQAFSEAADIMRGYQTALINANGNDYTNEEEDYTKANEIVVNREKQIYLKLAPTISSVSDGVTLNGQVSADIWVGGVLGAESVWAKIIPPNINPEEDGVPITDLDTVQLLKVQSTDIYTGTYAGFNIEGTYAIVINAQTSQEIYSYVQAATVTQTIISSPVYTSVTQMSGIQDISSDSYEEDDTYSQANVIVLNNLDAQLHSFHDTGDVDCVKFYGLSGQTYTIKASNLSILCDAVIDFYDSDGETRLIGPINNSGAGDNESLEWTCTQNGLYYVKISNANSAFGENVKYDLKVYQPVGGILQTLVSGAITDDNTGAPIGNALIIISSSTSDISTSAISFANTNVGQYKMSNIPGTFTFTISNEEEGYPARVYTNIEIEETLTMTLNFTIEPDSDGDGVIDDLEPDSDGDGVIDDIDMFPSDPDESLDTDEDGTGNNADVDDDNDGIDDIIEVGGPNSGDANNDGMIDSLQNNVACIASYTTQSYVVIESPNGTALTNCQATDNPSQMDAPAGINFNYGFFNFTINDMTPGSSTLLTLTLPSGEVPITYYKYGKTPANQTDHWYAFLYDNETGAEINDNVITLHFTDALRGDDLLTQDSMVVDLGAPGFDANAVDLEPTASIVSPDTDTTITAGGSVNFQGSVTSGNATFTYSWDFGGGASNVNVEDPGNVAFSTAGTYTVTFTVTDIDNDTNSDIVTITVNAPADDGSSDGGGGGGGGGGCFIGTAKSDRISLPKFP